MRAAWNRWRELKRQRRWLGWLEEAVVVVAVLGLVFAWQTRNLVRSGEPVPAFELMSRDGAEVSSGSLLGKKTVLHFWAPWCGVCAADTGAISSFAKSYGEDVNVVSIALAWEDRADVERFVRENAVDYPVLLGDDRTMRAFKVDTFPTTYFLSPEGTIERATVGYTTGLGLRLRLLFL